MVGLRKPTGFGGKTRKEAGSRHSIGRSQEKKEKEKTWRVCIFGGRVLLTASSASEHPQKFKDKTNYIKDNQFNNKVHGKLYLLWPGVVSPVSFFHKTTWLPFFFSFWYTFAIIMQPMIIRPITSKNLGGFRVSAWGKDKLHLMNLKICVQ